MRNEVKSMKIRLSILLVILSIFLLTGCSLQDHVEKKYKAEAPIDATFIIPKSMAAHVPQTVQVTLKQNGKMMTNPDYVHYEMWKQDGSMSLPMNEMNEVRDGVYEVTKSFDRDGLYFLKIHAGKQDAQIMPTAQLIVGKLSPSEQDFLQKGAVEPPKDHQHHH